MAERQPSRAQSASSRKRMPKAAKPGGAGVATSAATSDSPLKTVGDPAGVADNARIQGLEAERDRLRFELDAAQERIALLESSRQEVLDRIAWVIDSLHSLDKD